jgi:hypothetical protein
MGVRLSHIIKKIDRSKREKNIYYYNEWPNIKIDKRKYENAKKCP